MKVRILDPSAGVMEAKGLGAHLLRAFFRYRAG